ncbi:hypothetical protein [Rubellicoccus peritrichatus]|uniref:Ice-binding protein C-terminal domain-containing protein n=1 Tax=Rubellicoccus peritrichatus TaxID=3080537 RepID=A0AAQ3QUC5_9BACT|nr:hypothetical protein [Puniceicoccus sp. CR14]WOO39810.1 hypothetical protein RZN69_14390 [Puniceicoccus sp. CR14]
MHLDKNKKHKLTTITIGALLGSSSLNAIIVTNANLGLNGGIAGNRNGDFEWDIDDDGTAEVTILSGPDFGGYMDLIRPNNGFEARATGTGARDDLLSLGADTYVNAGIFNDGIIFSVFYRGNFSNVAGFTSGESGYIGFQFNPSGSLVLYGWAEVILTEGGATGTFEIVQWAYDNTGANIQTGAIPEPATIATGLGALALGAAGLRRWRKAKQAA